MILMLCSLSALGRVRWMIEILNTSRMNTTRRHQLTLSTFNKQYGYIYIICQK